MDKFLDMTLADIASVGHCSNECEKGRDCLYKVRMGDVNKLRDFFWKTRTQAAPMPKEKKTKIHTKKVCDYLKHKNAKK